MKLVLAVAGVVVGAALLTGVAFGAVGASAPLALTDTLAPLSPTTPVAEDAKDGGRLSAILDKLVQQGVITHDQENKILAAVKTAAGARARVRHDLVAAAADAIGITPARLRQELPGKSLAQVAQAHDVSRDALVQKLTAAVNGDIDKALAAGKITADQGSALKSKTADLVAKGVDRVFPASTGPRVHLARTVIGGVMRDAANIIGITPAQLRQELPGKSLAQVAQAHDVSRDALVQKLIADADAKIDQAQQKGTLTADQAQKLRVAAPTTIAKLVDRTVADRK